MSMTSLDRFPPIADRRLTLIELLNYRAESQPDRLAYIHLIDGESKEASITYNALHEQARAIGALLQSRGMAGERALLLYQPGLEFIGAFFGCLYAGVVPVPAYPPDTARLNRSLPRFQSLMADAEAKAALTSSAILSAAEPLLAQMPASRSLLWLATDDIDGGLKSAWKKPDVNERDLAFLQYTSGSTGSPRGVMLSHENLLHNANMVYRAMEHTPEDKYISWLPMFHDMGFMAGVLQPLFAGIPAVLMSPVSFLQKPVRWLKAISKYRGTTSGGPNFAYDLCVRKVTPEERETLNLSSWTVAFNGAEPVRAKTLESFTKTFESCGFRLEAFYPCYGLAEATLIVSGGRKSAPPAILNDGPAGLSWSSESGVASREDESGRKWVGCGQGLFDQKVMIVNPETLIECSEGEVGEIWVAGKSVARGYWNRPEETERTFNAYLSNTGEGPFLRTGDLGFLRHGNLFIAGRRKDLIIIRGRNHYPQDIELTVEQCHPALRPGCGAAFSVDVSGEEKLVVVYEIDERKPIDLAELTSRIQQAIAEAHELQAHSIVLIKAGTIPKTSSGKIQRYACRAAFQARSLDVVFEHPARAAQAKTGASDAAREALAERVRAFEEKLAAEAAVALDLPVSEIDVNKPLARYGLDSLNAVELAHSVERIFGVNLPLGVFLGGASVSQLVSEAIAIAGDAMLKPQSEALPATTAAEFHPLSEGQKGLWFLQQLSRDNTAYSIARAMRIRSELDVDALRRAFQALVDRHACLRTTFHEIDGEPVQKIQERAELSFRAQDASSWSDDELRAHLAREAARPFDLEHGPLFRVELLLRAPGEHVMLLNVHHIVSDFWSLAVLVKELAAFYEAEINGVAARLPRLALEYTDYVRRQSETLSGPEGERLWQYWRERLSGDLPVLNLPTDRPRPATPANRGGVVHFRLGSYLTEELKTLSRSMGVTLYTTLLASFDILLHRHTGQKEILVGSPTVGRKSARLAGLLGYFVNPVVMRGDLSGDPTFEQLAERMREEVLSALGHAGYPLPLLVKKLRPGQGDSSAPLFQAMFVLQNIHMLEKEGLGSFALGVEGGKLQVGELSFESMSIGHRAPQVDLTLMVSEDDGELKAIFEYDADLFDETTIERMAARYRRLLESVVTNPHQRISRLQYLPDDELHQLLYGWNRNRKDYIRHFRIHDFFERQAGLTPDAIALVCGDQSFSYAELNRRANQLGRYLKKRGAGPGSLVAVCVERRAELIVTLLAILKSGAAYVPLDPAYPQDRLEFMLEDTGAVVIVTRSGLAEKFATGGTRRIEIDLEWEEIAGEEDSDVESGASPGDLAYVIYTSGSTGRPKGVAIEHRSAVTFLQWARDEFSDEELSGVLAGTSICFDLSVYEIFGPLSWGGKVILAENALALGEIESRESVRLINTVPSAIGELIRMGSLPESVKVVNLAGEPLRNSLAQEVYREGNVERVLNLYGPSEDTTYSTYVEVEKGSEREVTIGRGITNTEVYVLDENMEPVGIGVVGEIYIGGEGLARGYLGRAEITGEKFVPDPYGEEEGGRLYRTGDLGRLRADGEIEFLGRRDHQVKIKGYRIELGEIESALEGHEAIESCAVIAREGEGGEKWLAAYIVAAEGAKISGREIREYLKRKLPAYMSPQEVIELERMPLTPNGKVDRKKLSEIRGEERSESGYEAPRNYIEEALAEIWQDALGVKRVGVKDNFFELGGHSLLATQVVARVRRTLGVELGLREVFEVGSLEEMGSRIAERMGMARKNEAPAIVKRERSGATPLSYGQQRLWFLDQLEGGSNAYNMVAALKMKGELDLGLLEEAINRVIERHETLRTRFENLQGRPVQVVEEGIRLSLEVEDVSGREERERERRVEEALLEESDYRFDLSKAPLIRARVVKVGSDEHVMVLNVHHIVSDGWSMGILAREMGRAYEALWKGEDEGLAELEAQYGDYAEWQREWMSGETLEAELEYWKKRLEGAEMALNLPTDRPRPAVQSYRGAVHSFTLPESFYEPLKEFGRRHGATLFMTLLAAFKTLLHRYSGQKDILVGTPVTNRNRAEIEPLIGFFVNTLALRTDFSDDPSFSDLVSRVRDGAIDAYAHLELPFEKLVEEIQPQRSLNHSPIFQVMFSFQNAPRADLNVAGLELSFLGIEGRTAKFDLTLSMIERAGVIEGAFEYNTDLFDRETVIRLTRHFQTLLEAAYASPEQRVSQLPLLTASESERLLIDWNRTESEFPVEHCIHDLFEAQVNRTPDKTAVVFEDKQITYRELDARAEKLAKYLRARKVGAEALVGVCVDRSIDMVVATLGVLKAGGAYAPIDPAYPRQRIDLVLEDARPKVIVTESGLAEMFEGRDAEVIRIDGEWDKIERGGQWESESRACPENNAYVIFTSGSTGRPKGIQVTHRNVVNFLTSMERQLSLTSQDVLLAVTTLSFDIAGLELFLPLITGGQVVIVSREIAIDGVRLKKELIERQATIMQATPATWQLLIRSGWEGSDSFKALCGGEALTAELANELAARSGQVWNLYGPTETTIWSTAHELRRGAGAPPIGRPIANTQIYILDSSKQPVPIGVPGELYIGGDGVSRGYFNQPGLTADKFVPDPFGAHGQRLYRTGDLVRYLPDGGIEFLGRIDHQVKIRGFRIELGDIESALRGHEAVREAVVVARTDANGDKLLAGYVVAESEGLSVSALREYLRERLPEYMVPATIVKMESLPLTPNGKIDRKKLPDPKNHLQEVAFVAPQSKVEKDIARVWQEVLGRERVGVNDNFFDLGGHSLLLIEAQNKLQAALGRDVLIVEMFKYPTVSSLARHLTEDRDNRSRSSRATDRGKKRREAMNTAQHASRGRN